MCFKREFKNAEPRNKVVGLLRSLNQEFADKGFSFGVVIEPPVQFWGADPRYPVHVPPSGDQTNLPDHVILQVINIALVKEIEDSIPLEGSGSGSGLGSVEMAPVIINNTILGKPLNR